MRNKAAAQYVDFQSSRMRCNPLLTIWACAADEMFRGADGVAIKITAGWEKGLNQALP